MGFEIGDTLILKKSNRKGKRFMILMPNPKPHKHHFGAEPFDKGTFIDHKDEKLKKAWIARHKDDKNYNNPMSGIFYSRFLLWTEKTLGEAIKKLEKKHKVKIINKTGLK
jgi:hypothetical protein